MRLRQALAAAMAVAATIMVGGAALAHEETPYVCTESGTADGKAGFSGSAALVLQTAKSGKSSTGCTLENDEEIFRGLSFAMVGTGDNKAGVYVVVKGHYPDGTEVEAGLPISAARETKAQGYSNYSLRYTQFPFTKDVASEVTTITLFPGNTAARKVTIGNVRINGKTLKNILKSVNDCPVDFEP